MSNIEVRALEAAELPLWQDLIAASPEGSIYSDTRYLDALCAATGASYRVSGVWRDGKLEGGIATYECRSLHGTVAAPRLLLYYHSPVLRRHPTKYPSEQTSRLTKACSALAVAVRRRGFGSMVLKCRPSLTDVRPFIEAGFTVRPSYTYVVPISDLRAQWDRVERNLRRLIKRCEDKEQLAFCADDDFDAFFRMHSETLARKHTGRYLPEPEFATFFARLKDQNLASIYTARLPDGRAIATQLVLLGPYATSHTVSAGGDAAYANTGAQAFLRWKSFEHMSALGYRFNDLTDAALNSVTHFKSQFGGDLAVVFVLETPQTLRFVAGRRASEVVRRGAGLARRAAMLMLGSAAT